MSISKIRRKNRKIGQTFTEHPITSAVNPFITKDDKILTIGSCFALEVRRWLTSNGFDVFSQDRYELIWYNTYTILAEFERASGKWSQSDDDVWSLGDRWQDPYRRCVFAESKQELLDEIHRLDRSFRKAIVESDIIIITLGLTEVFVNHRDRVICAAPGYCGGGGKDCSFFASDYEDNYINISSAIGCLREVNPKCKVILTVSPVPFFATFREMDHFVANTASKSILRAVADKVEKENDNVYYFHSYELVMCEDREGVYKRDGRHVRPEYVCQIMERFERMFVK